MHAYFSLSFVLDNFVTLHLNDNDIRVVVTVVYVDIVTPGGAGMYWNNIISLCSFNILYIHL
jgi:hypothetical protein